MIIGVQEQGRPCLCVGGMKLMEAIQVHLKHGVAIHHQKFIIKMLKHRQSSAGCTARCSIVDTLHLQAPILVLLAETHYMFRGMIDEQNQPIKTKTF